MTHSHRVGLLNNNNPVNTGNPLPVEIPPCICDENSTSTPLPADTGGVDHIFTGEPVKTNGYGIIYINVYSDVASATDGLVIEQSSDGSHWDFSDVYTVPADTGKTYSVQPAGRYVRVKYTNGGSDQTSFRLQTVMKQNGLDSSHRVQDTLNDDDDGRLRIVIPKLRTAQNTYISQGATAAGNAKVAIEELESGISTNNNSQLKTTPYLSNGNEGIAAADSPSIDAFGRWRVSDTGQRFDIEFIYDKQPGLMDEVTANGGTISHNSSSRDVTLAVNTANGNESAEFCQHWHNPYTPGNSQLIDITGTFDAAGIGSGTASIFLKNGIDSSETEITQDNWNDTVSDVDWSKSQIFSIDFQSLKVGRLRFFLVRNGVPVKLHEINNDNLRTGGYWQYPNQPLNWKIYNDGTYTIAEIGYFNDTNGVGFRYKIAQNADAEMRAICGTVKSEGGPDLFDIEGFKRSIDMGVTSKTVGTTLIPLISIRVKTTFNSLTNHGLFIPESWTLQTDNPIRLVIIKNATLTGASWADVNINNSAMEYDISATAVSGGSAVISEYDGAGSKNSTLSGGGLLGKSLLSYGHDGSQDTLTIAAVRTTSTSAAVLAGLGWSEIR